MTTFLAWFTALPGWIYENSEPWSWYLTTIGVTSMFMIRKHLWQGWLLGIVVQFSWATYAVFTQQWGFIVSALLYGYIAVTGMLKWRAEAQVTRELEEFVDRVRDIPGEHELTRKEGVLKITVS